MIIIGETWKMKDRASKWNNFQLMFFKSQQLLVWVHVTEFSASARSCQTFFFFVVSDVMVIYFEGIDWHLLRFY